MAMNTDALMNRLFRWRSTIDIDGIKFYVRIVSDQTVDDARREALLASRKLRRDLRDQNTDDYLIYIDPLNDLEDDQLRTLITTNSMREVMREYMNTTPRPVIEPLGDNPTQEEQEEWEAAREARNDEYVADMTRYVEDWQKTFVEGLEKQDRQRLFNWAQRMRVDQVCEDKFTEVFEERIVAESVYTDTTYKTKMFSLKQFRELPAEVRQKLRDAYNNMSVSPDDIKN